LLLKNSTTKPDLMILATNFYLQAAKLKPDVSEVYYELGRLLFYRFISEGRNNGDFFCFENCYLYI